MSGPHSSSLIPPRAIDYHAELNQEQLAVVLAGDGPRLVLAGAGSGKTRTITYRVARLLEDGVPPERMLLLTFTNKAAREMIGRLRSLVGPQAEGIWSGTFHSVANRLLRANAEAIGINPRFTILDQDDAQSLLKAVLKEQGIDPKARRFPTANVIQSIASLAHNTRSSIADVIEWRHPHFVSFAGEIEQVVKSYAERKVASRVMDFDDLLLAWHAMMQDQNVGKRMSEYFLHVLVDEYQDTNALQDSIVYALGQRHRNVVVVGDDAQSIYAFRGADVKNILRFPEVWPEATIHKLVVNYRSTPEILDLANTSLSHNTQQFQKELVSMRKSGPKPVLFAASSAREEARYVADQILTLRSEGVALQNMAVLFRSSAHSQALEFELMSRDIPYEYRGGMKFFERAHIKDTLAYVRIVENVHDEAAWLRVLSLQTGIGATTASRIMQQIRTQSSFTELFHPAFISVLPARAREGWRELEVTATGLIGAAPSPSLTIRAILDAGYREYLEREYPDWRERIEAVEQLASFAESYTDLSSFLSDIALYDDVVAAERRRSHPQDEERMILSTVHQAKGLEWDTVFVIHLSDAAFPNRRAMEEEGGVEEERRLFYVAMTRARRKLILSYPLTTGRETLSFNQASLFIEELPPHLLERVELRRMGTSVFRDRLPAAKTDEWSWDASSDADEPTIQIGNDGERY